MYDAENLIPRKCHQRHPGTVLSVQTIETRLNPQQLMSQLTSRIRLYGADCNQTALVVRHSNFLKISSTYLYHWHSLKRLSRPKSTCRSMSATMSYQIILSYTRGSVTLSKTLCKLMVPIMWLESLLEMSSCSSMVQLVKDRRDADMT